MRFSLHDIDYLKLRDQLIASGQRLDVNVGQYPLPAHSMTNRCWNENAIAVNLKQREGVW